MKFLAVSKPGPVANEPQLIRALFAYGIERIHLRKPEQEFSDSGSGFRPGEAICYLRALLRELTPSERRRIVIHDYGELYEEFSLGGMHVNRNLTMLPEGYRGVKSRSCHSLEEVIRYKEEYDYLFLSPIFDSISKAGYRSAFSEEVLRRAAQEGIIDHKVIALGGVTFDRIPFIRSLNFGGAALLGAIYDLGLLERLPPLEGQ